MTRMTTRAPDVHTLEHTRLQTLRRTAHTRMIVGACSTTQGATHNTLFFVRA